MSQSRLRSFHSRLIQPYFKPKTWTFWRALIFCFIFGSMLGHWLEIPYCTFMNLFGVVEDNYAALNDPLYVPYFVYGFGALGMTLGLEPIKERVLNSRKTGWGALLETFLIMVFLAMAMELAFGLIINQPNANGVYPYWDNSQLPGNILHQAWIVNDLVIGSVAMIYVWLIFPLVNMMFERIPKLPANSIIAVSTPVFALCAIVSIPYLL